MQDLWQWLWIVPASLVGLYVVIAAAGAFSVWGFSRATVSPVSELEAQTMRSKAERSIDADWLAEQGFEHAGCFRLQTPIGTPGIVGWKHAGGSIFFCCYLMPNGLSSDFVSIMADRTGVTTGTQADGLLLPPSPGSWMQAFPGKTLQERWALHLEAETTVAEATGTPPAEAIGTLDQEMTEAIARQIGYVRSLTFWPLRIPLWYVYRRFGLVNKKVADQMRR